MTKFYAIVTPEGRSTIVHDWATCQARTQSISNGLFKSFKTKQKALDWIDTQKNNLHTLPENNNEAEKYFSPDEVVVFVDGSFMENTSEHAGWGWVAIQSQVELASDYGKTKKSALSRNIDGEIFACLEALKWAKRTKLKKVTIVYDYAGIAAWANQQWKANKEISQHYVEALKEFSNIQIKFVKVQAHSGNVWNDKADALAKRGLEG